MKKFLKNQENKLTKFQKIMYKKVSDFFFFFSKFHKNELSLFYIEDCKLTKSDA